MWIQIESGTETLYGSHRTALGALYAVLDAGAATLIGEECTQEGAQHLSREPRVPGAAITQGVGQREDPLAQGHFRQYAVHEVGRGVCHASSAAGRT
jgi:hypothetical protein